MDPAAMSDDELTQACAVEVMGWTAIEDSTGYSFNGRRICFGWYPLLDWNCTHQVIDAMRAKGMSFEWIGDEVEFILPDEGLEHPDRAACYTSKATQQRAILEAALIAVRAAKGVTT